jgi:glycosyltransferase involved in cell wall biosynthesis
VFEQHALSLAAGAWLPASTYRRKPVVSLTCWVAERAQHLTRARRRALATLARRVDRWLVFSQNQAPLLAEHLGIDESRVVFVPFGVNLRTVQPAIDAAAEHDADSRSGPLRVLSVGKDIGRDYRTLFRAVQHRDVSLQVVCWGRNLPTDMPIPPNVQISRRLPRDDYLRTLGQCDLVVIPTHAIAYPTGQTVLLQAWAAGKPVITTDRPAIRDYVRDGVDGVLTPPLDAEALGVAIESLLDDEGRRHALGRAGADRVRNGFTERHMWDAVDRQLRSVLRP